MYYVLCTSRGLSGSVCFAQKLDSFTFDGKEEHDHVFQVVKWESCICIGRTYRMENFVLEERGYSLLTFSELGLAPPNYLVRRFLLKERCPLPLLEEYWSIAISDRKFFSLYLQLVCSREDIQTLQFWLDKAEKRNFNLFLYSVASCYYSPLVCDFFFRQGVQSCDPCLCRLSIHNAIRRERSLLCTWKKYVKTLDKQHPFYYVVERGSVLDLFDYRLGTYFAPKYALEEVKERKELERLFLNAPNFTPRPQALDKASEEGRLDLLTFWFEKALRYGPEFIHYNSALDLAAEAGHLSVLEFWSHCCQVFNIPLLHSSRLVSHALKTKDFALLNWWKLYSKKHIREEDVYLALREANLCLVKFLCSLPQRHSWTYFSYRVPFCSVEIKEWWKREGKERFWSEE